MATKRTRPTREAALAARPPDLDTEVAHRLVDPFETTFQGVVRTNDPLLLERGGAAAWELYRDLKRDGKVFSGLQKRKLAVVSRPWQVEPVKDDARGQADATIVTSILKNANFDGLCSDLMDALLVGFAPAEIVYGLQDNLVVPKRVLKRAQRRFVYVQTDMAMPAQLRMLTRENMITGVELPDRKFLVHRVNAEDDNPYGTGLGLQLYWPVFFKRKGIVSWNKLNDRFGSPTAWGKYPRNSGPREKSTLFDALRAMSNDGFFMTPEGMDVSLLESKLSGNITTQQNLCEYMDDWIMEVILGQSPRSKGGGALAAASSEREDVRIELSQADSDLLSETLNSTYLTWICELNGLQPCMVYRVIKKDEDLKAASETDSNVSGMGFKMSVAGVKAKYGEHWEAAPTPTPGRPPVIALPEQAANDPAAPAQDASAASFSEAAAPTPADRIARALGAGGDLVLRDWMERIRAMVDGADGPDMLRERLLAAYSDLPSDDLVELMALAFAAAELVGMNAVLVDGLSPGDF
ncbi:DUF935 domain-containing protein [Variovorax boronicumulans]|uniref:DUF935 domain-containing protein n=1 Tax=Variovorax boronicumulans TaxID=436515 RepID=UPI001C590C84